MESIKKLLNKLFIQSKYSKSDSDLQVQSCSCKELLQSIVARELEKTPCKPNQARQFYDLFRQKKGRIELFDETESIIKSHPDSLLIRYVRAVGFAEQENFDAAYKLANETILECKEPGRQLSELKRAQELWMVVDMIARDALVHARPSSIFSSFAGGGDSYDEDKIVIKPEDVKPFLIIADQLLEARRHSEYLAVCYKLFQSSSDLDEQLKCIFKMINTTRRRLPSYREAYSLARECYQQSAEQWHELLHSDLNQALEAIQKLPAHKKSLVQIYSLSELLGFSEHESRLGNLLCNYVKSLNGAPSCWNIVSALQQNKKHMDLGRGLAKNNMQHPVSKEEVRSFFKWADQAGCYAEADSIYESLSPKIRSSSAVLPYAQICEKQSHFKKASAVVSSVASELARKPYKMSFKLHWSLCDNRLGELEFFSKTSSLLGRFNQPENPQGVVFITHRNFKRLRRIPFVVLMELKKQGWAIIPLTEGLIPVEPTGDPEIDRFAACISSSGEVKSDRKEIMQSVDNLEADYTKGSLRWKDMDLSHVLWEEASIRRRCYNVDYTCPDLIKSLQKMGNWVHSYLTAAENIRSVFKKKGLPVCFFVTDIHRLPNAVFRYYCELYGDPNQLFCVHGINAYQNYFDNFSSNVSSSYAARNLTAHAHTRSALLPEPSEFNHWYQNNKLHKDKNLIEIENIPKIPRSSVHNNTEHRENSRKCLETIRKWRKNEGKIACLFGKVPCDLGVPFDGGPAHVNMKDWLNHSIDAVKNSETLLLIKPHPHELNNEISRFLSENFLDLIETQLPDNVVILGHNWFDMHDLLGKIDIGVVYNGTSIVELGLMGIPAVMCSHFAPIDYPVGQCMVKDRAHFEKLIRFEEPVNVAADLKSRSAAWLYYFKSEAVSVPYRYHARQVTNKVLYPPWWFDEDVEAYLKKGDPHVERLAGRITNYQNDRISFVDPMGK